MEEKEKRIFNINPPNIDEKDIEKFMSDAIKSMKKQTPTFTMNVPRLSTIEKLVKSVPNDMELGKQVRNLFK